MAPESRRGERHPLQSESGGERIVIVGTGEWGAVAFEYFRYDSPHEVVAFSAEALFITSDTYYGLPVVPFEELAQAYPPDEYRAFVAASSVQLNRVRRRLYDGVKAAGFDCVSYVSSHAFVLPDVEIGENVFVQEHAELAFMSRLGDNVLLGCGVCVGHGSVIENDCYAGPHATVCGLNTVGRSTFLGAHSCITEGVGVAEDCVIGAGAVVWEDTERRQVYVGNPAHPTGRDSFDTFGVPPGSVTPMDYPQEPPTRRS
jgi:sugar O-acyltransferase (sialic acid O-acetyltransferase NeuD family)